MTVGSERHGYQRLMIHQTDVTGLVPSDARCQGGREAASESLYVLSPGTRIYFIARYMPAKHH